MTYITGDTFYVDFSTEDASGALVDANPAPIWVLYKNGVAGASAKQFHPIASNSIATASLTGTVAFIALLLIILRQRLSPRYHRRYSIGPPSCDGQIINVNSDDHGFYCQVAPRQHTVSLGTRLFLPASQDRARLRALAEDQPAGSETERHHLMIPRWAITV